MKQASAILFGVTLMLAPLLTTAAETSTFGDDLAFLEEHVETIVLFDAGGDAQVAVVPAWQARVVTSTASGPKGLSYGWINRKLIASREVRTNANLYGGEDRFWIGPEAGQYGLFFPPGAPFELDNWKVPPVIDTEPFELVKKNAGEVICRREATLTNYAGTAFSLLIDRAVRLLDRPRIEKDFGIKLTDALRAVAYETDNKITNTGEQAWKKETGLLSIWILGMFNPSPDTTIVIPFKAGPESELGPKVNASYYAVIPEERLQVKEDVLFYRGDGAFRSKLGISPPRAKSLLGSYDARNNVLTLVRFTEPDASADYVNSMYEIQKDPYGGDVVNSYNDGPPTPGAEQLGPFYELETSSPAAALAPGESVRHVSRTAHVQGAEAALDEVAKAALGVGLDEIRTALP